MKLNTVEGQLSPKTAKQCKDKCRRMGQLALQYSVWSSVQEESLKALIGEDEWQTGDISWAPLYKKAGADDLLKTFKPKQIHDHVTGVMRHDSVEWTLEEEKKLIELAHTVYNENTGEFYWTDLEAQFPGKKSRDMAIQFENIQKRNGSYEIAYSEGGQS